MTKTRGFGFFPKSISSSPDWNQINQLTTIWIQTFWPVGIPTIGVAPRHHCCWPVLNKISCNPDAIKKVFTDLESFCWRPRYRSVRPWVWIPLRNPPSARSCDPCSSLAVKWMMLILNFFAIKLKYLANPLLDSSGRRQGGPHYPCCPSGWQV